jgi:hypothetical protein
MKRTKTAKGKTSRSRGRVRPGKAVTIRLTPEQREQIRRASNGRSRISTLRLQPDLDLRLRTLKMTLTQIEKIKLLCLSTSDEVWA